MRNLAKRIIFLWQKSRVLILLDRPDLAKYECRSRHGKAPRVYNVETLNCSHDFI
jgi:hypothetical protein